MIKKLLFILTLIITLTISFTFITPAHQAEAAPVLKYGAHDGFVWGLQNRLQQLGIYKGKIDGVFGTGTKQAVILFQKRNGLRIDGIAGTNTWRVLRNQTYTQNEIQMLAQLVHGEARGESLTGQVAVAAVVLNRIDSNKFPDQIKNVIFQPSAFTATADGQYYLKPTSESYRAVYLAIRGWDPTDGALFYFNPKTATSKWIWSRPQIKQIGKHIFTR